MTKKNIIPSGADFIEHYWEESWAYIKTVVDVVREPVLILDKDLKVIAANEPFYQTFQVRPKDTEKKVVYKLGNGQWNIPALRDLLEDILPKHTFFKGFQVAHQFPTIGRKVMILNARQIFCKANSSSREFLPIILLAIEDVTEMMMIAEDLAAQANRLHGKLTDRVNKLEKEVIQLKKKSR